jgi:hypothetical protein
MSTRGGYHRELSEPCGSLQTQSGSEKCVNTTRSLTHSLASPRRG